MATSDASFELPRAFGKYRLVRHLARGGMGDVFLATLEGALGFEQTLVIKTILPELAEDPRFVDLFAAEAKTAVLLSHGNIVPIYELGEHQGVLYIAMAYIDGAPLSEIVAAARRDRTPLPEPVVLHIVRQILEGMAYAHAGDRNRPPLVHRDLSPRNVLVERSGQVRIVDFGIAMFAHAGRGARMGSAGYAAPEQQRAAAPDPRADVFSIGALLYELLTLEPAFSRAGVYAAPDLAPIPEDLRPVLARALDLDPERRYPDAGAFLEALAPVLARRAATTTNRDVARRVAALVASRQDASDGGDEAPTPVTPVTVAAPTARTAATRTFATRLDATSATATPATAPATSKIGRFRIPALLVLTGGAVGMAAWVALSAAAPARPRRPSPPGVHGPVAVPTAQTPAVPDPAPSPHAEADPPRPPPEPDEPAPPPPARPRAEADPAGDGSPPKGPAPSHARDERPGRLTVLAPSVPWADVYLDGRRIGHTPLVRRQTASGRHRLRVVCRPPVCDGERVLVQRTLLIAPGRTAEVQAP